MADQSIVTSINLHSHCTRRSFLCRTFHIRRLHADTRYAKLSSVMIPDAADMISRGEYLLVEIIEFLLSYKKFSQFAPVLSNMAKVEQDDNCIAGLFVIS